MKGRDIVIGAIAIIAILFVASRLRSPDPQITTNQPSPSQDEQKQLEEITKRVLPAEGERITLNDVEGVGASAIATRSFEDNLTIITILADLPELQAGESYQAWAESGEESDPNYELLTLGLMARQKGGWLGEFEINKDLSSFKYLVISREQRIDASIETVVVAGSTE